MNGLPRDLQVVLDRFEGRCAQIGVIGLGYVGIPLAVTAARAGFSVLGFDINESRVSLLNTGGVVLSHIPASVIREVLDTGRFEATADFTRLGEPDALLICVPTPLSKHREPDLSFVVSTVQSVASRLRAGQLVVLESTTYPGTTDEVVRPILEATGLRSGADFFLAYSPEREDPGNKDFGTSSTPKVLGADGDAALAVATSLYEQLVSQVVQVPSMATAEAVKLTENIFRAVNIALVNELKVVYNAMGIDVWKVIEAASTKPFGFMPFYPGPGLGGHCIPIDPFYLTWKAREYDIATRFIELAGEINIRMPYYVVDNLSQALDKHRRRTLHQANILIIGVAYKKNVDDMRESPALKLIEIIELRGGTCDFYDPHVPEIPLTREHAQLTGRKSIRLTAASIAKYDAVLIATDHDNVDYAGLAKNAQLIVDTRNVFERLGITPDTIVKT